MVTIGMGTEGQDLSSANSKNMEIDTINSSQSFKQRSISRIIARWIMLLVRFGNSRLCLFG